MMEFKYLRRYLFKILKRSDLIYTINFFIRDRKDLIENYKAMKSSTLKSKEKIKEELRICRTYWKCNCWYYYVHYELYNKLLSEDELLDYVPPFYFANVHQEKYQEGIDIVKLSNKLEQYYLFKERGIATPEVIYLVYKGNIYEPSSNVKINLKEQKEYDTPQKLFIKPVGNAGGFGIVVKHSLKELDEGLHELSSKGTYIVQKTLIQRSDFNKINASCVNTLRVIVHQEGKKMKMVLCILRMGRNNSDVDNSAQGGISISIDINNGQFQNYATAEHGGGVYKCHPDTGYMFNGCINGWNEIKDEIEKYATKLIDLKDLALDVAITENGVSIIEFNFGYGIDHIQKTMGGIRKVLNVKGPSIK